MLAIWGWREHKYSFLIWSLADYCENCGAFSRGIELEAASLSCRI